ncbi:uncharacterized protein LOC129296932 [Prosopis cineraria]|uniref:uncharacterized protein LOC129296932 n=1 Tax=Prosopis cineraria TaxID=364024 RepID=UPI0024106A4E|nr:uncharacterized protein LOC129296932 [Prosopis cineraria]
MIVLRRGMAYCTKFLHPIKHSITVISSHSSSFSHLKRSNYGKFDFIKTFLKTIEPSVCGRSSIFKSDVHIARKYLRNIYFCGNKFSSGIILGTSIAYGSVMAYAMDAQDALVDEPYEDSLDLSEEEEHRHHLWMLARRFWLPVFLFLTVLTNLDDPILLLLIKVTLFLLSTKPNPYSVYVFIDELCQQCMRQEPSLHKSKSLYASKVEVQDCKLLCLANIEVRNQSFTLVGVLGNWWNLPHIMPHEAFSLIRDRLGSMLVKAT